MVIWQTWQQVWNFLLHYFSESGKIHPAVHPAAAQLLPWIRENHIMTDQSHRTTVPLRSITMIDTISLTLIAQFMLLWHSEYWNLYPTIWEVNRDKVEEKKIQEHMSLEWTQIPVLNISSFDPKWTPTPNVSQCNLRYFNFLNPPLNMYPWTQIIGNITISVVLR